MTKQVMAGDIPVYCSHDELVDVVKIVGNPRNPNMHDDNQIELLARIIKEQGWRKPITVSNRSGFVVSGHGRLAAAIKLKATVVPVDYQDYATEADEWADLIADNRLAELSEIDNNVLEELLQEMKEFDDFDFSLTGYSIDEFEELFNAIDLLEAEEAAVVEDEYDAELPEEPKAKYGDIYQLGNHRLMCGDSTSIDDVEKLMNGNKADMVFTDPPYRMEVQGGSNQWVGQQAAKLGESIKDLCDFNPDEFLKRLEELFDKSMNAYIFCNKDLVFDYLNWGLSKGFAFNILFWKKPNALPLGGQHRPDVEYLLFFRKNAIWNNGLEDTSYSKCLEFGRDHSTSHPTMKPLELIGNELKISSNKNSNVVDLFGGSGSTLIACEQLNRQCYMMELDPKYIDVIISRWEQFTGQKAVLLERNN